MEIKKTYLTDQHAQMLGVHCRGCRIFKPEVNVRDICSIIGWYVDVVSGDMIMLTLLGYVKGCPCNQKCLVKAACKDNLCPDWMKYTIKIGDKRMEALRKSICKKNRSRKS